MPTTASFTPLTITVETLQILAREEEYSNLLTLYMAYVEITTWQHTDSIKASKTFMMKRLRWGEDRFIRTKAKLVEMGLLQTADRRTNEGKIAGHYVLVRHIVNQNPLKPSAGFHHAQVSEGTSTTNLKESTTNLQKSAGADAQRTKEKEELLPELILLVNPKEKPTADRQRALNARLKDYTPDEIRAAARAFSKSKWHVENKQMSIDNLLAPSKFGRWYQASQEQKGKSYDPRVYGEGFVPPEEVELDENGLDPRSYS